MHKYLLFLFAIITSSLTAQNVLINEIMSSNKVTIYDEDGDASDWIELYNISAVQVDLTGFALSDDTTKTQKWIFGSTVINPGEYLIVFASSKDRKTGELHTNFNVSAGGESILIAGVNGVVIDRVDLPALDADISYGRKTDGSSEWVKQNPSPGSSNTGEINTNIADSIFVSLPGGFYSSSISLTLTAGTSTIYYTLDGSDPDSTSTKYFAPVNITKTTVLKAVSYKANSLSSPVIYKTYFINENSDLPVISLSSDPYNLFDYNYGIYADGPGWTSPNPHFGANYWQDWERPAHVEFFDDEKKLGFSENCGIAIYGAWSRAFPQKSISIKFKDPYNANAINYKLFPDLDLSTFKAFVLRNSGNDFQYTHIRDAMMQTLIKDLDIDYLEYRPATTFINGEYWGIYNIREKINEHYVATHYGIDPDNIDMLENNMEVIHGDTQHYQQLIDYISTNDMTTDEAYNFVNSKIDLDECLLYFAAQSYYNNQDWPANNVKFWRERSETGKWRWIIYDLDFGFNLYESTGQSEDHVYYIFSGIETRPSSNPPWSTLLPRMLVKNPRIKNQFINLVADLLNTKFVSTRVVNIINQMADHIAGEISRHRARFGIQGENLNRMITFANERPSYLRGFVRNFFNCGNDGSITVNSTEGGKVQLNSINLKHTDMPWTGIYFRNNAINLKAVSNPGYKFAGWSGSVVSSDDSISVNVTGATNITAEFIADNSSTNGIVINEINYNSSKDFDSGDWIELYNSGNTSVDIGNWIYSDSDTSHKFVIPTGTILEPDKYLVLVGDLGKFTTLFAGVTNYIGEIGFGLDGSGEFMRLLDDNRQIIDSLTYDDNAPWPTSPDGNGATLELTDPLKDNAIGENWLGSIGHGSPGKINSVRTSVQEKVKNIIPDKLMLYQNYPNPFNPVTVINYSLPKQSYVTVKIFDTLGREVITLINEDKSAGNYSIEFDGTDLSSGIYFYRINANGFSKTMKMILMK